MDAEQADALLTVLRKHGVRTWLQDDKGMVRIELEPRTAAEVDAHAKPLKLVPRGDPADQDPKKAAERIADLLFAHEAP